VEEGRVLFNQARVRQSLNERRKALSEEGGREGGREGRESRGWTVEHQRER